MPRRRRALALLTITLTTGLLIGCDTTDNDTGPEAATTDEARALDEAAEMIAQGRPGDPAPPAEPSAAKPPSAATR